MLQSTNYHFIFQKMQCNYFNLEDNLNVPSQNNIESEVIQVLQINDCTYLDIQISFSMNPYLVAMKF